MMAETAKSGGQRATSARGAGRTSTAQADRAEPAAGEGVAGEQPTATGDAGQAEQQRTATLNLPFVTAQFRAPRLHMPGRGDMDSAARGARSLLPSPKAALYFGALAVTAAAGVIEWPVAAAIGVGTALASRGEANPEPSGRTAPAREESQERATADA
jgi:hypothetical protein